MHATADAARRPQPSGQQKNEIVQKRAKERRANVVPKMIEKNTVIWKVTTGKGVTANGGITLRPS